MDDKFHECGEKHGYPASVLTDNGMVYTTRFAGGRGGRNRLEVSLASLEIEQKNSRPNHPTTCGKVERFHQTLKRWLAAQPRAVTIEELQTQIDEFVDEYNHRRPHGSLGRRTPAVVYDLLPKAGPNGAGEDHYRVRNDRVDKTGAISLRRGGRMHNIGVGRAHAGKEVLMLIRNLDIRVIDKTTGELLREPFTLDPTRDYQPRLK